MLREIEKRDQQKVRTREKERERAEKALSFLLLRAARFVRCEVFQVTFGEPEDRETKRRYLYTSRAFGACV